MLATALLLLRSRAAPSIHGWMVPGGPPLPILCSIGYVRWIARFTSESGGVTLSEVHAALQALDALPAPDAHVTLTGLLKRHGLR
jgi:hypothetical protein